MPQICRICAHPKVEKINAELEAGYAIQGISVKHFGDANHVAELEEHRKHLAEAREEALPAAEPEEENEGPLTLPQGEDLPRPPNPIRFEEAPIGAIIACEPMRVKGLFYDTGEMIPESEWKPEHLASALRVGTVKRKGQEGSNASSPPPEPEL